MSGADPVRHTVSLPPGKIRQGTRLRAVDQAWVQVLAASIGSGGQHTPIQVRQDEDGKYCLIAGAHRLAACVSLGRFVVADVLPISAAEARIAEIDENLIRRELSPLDRAIALEERKAAWAEVHPERRGGDRKSQRKNQNEHDVRFDFAHFNDEVAKKTGFTVQHIRRWLALAKKLRAPIRARLSGTPHAESLADLMALARLPDPQAQGRALTLAADRGATIRGAISIMKQQDAPAEEPAGVPPRSVAFVTAVRALDACTDSDRRDFIAFMWERWPGEMLDLRPAAQRATTAPANDQ